MPDAPTPLDLDAIRERATQGYPFLGLWAACNDALVLVAENERLRAENERLRTICAGPPRHITAEDLEGLATSMLTARPAPAWDEEAVVEGMARAMYPFLFADDRQPLRVFGETRSDAELREGERDVARERMRQALAVVREHLPVKPDREVVVEAMLGADAILDLWPGRSEAEVKAEALREAERAANHDWLAFKSIWGSSPSDQATLAFAIKALDWLRARADRLAAEGGAS